ncbi:MAG: ABC transporter permease [Pseudomonadota bacterium]
MDDARGPRFLLARLALQNLGRRRIRTALLVAAVALSCAIAFAGAVVMRSIETSMSVGFSRLGADLMVVSRDALTHLTAALLTVEPTDSTLPADLLASESLPGIARAAPQRVLRTSLSGAGGAGESVDLIGFDPSTDFTVQPWLAERLPRAIGAGDVIVGSARTVPLGSELVIFGAPFRVYGKLSSTGVGTHERGIFLTSQSLLGLSRAISERTGSLPPMLRPDRVSGFLLELASGARELQVRFSLLSHFAEIKVVAGASLLTGIRQGLSALMGGAVALVALMFGATAVMVGVLFSAIVSERRVELGLLQAIGARRRQIVGLTLLEAVLATGAGGLLGVAGGALLLRLFERSLVFHLTQMGVPFLWLERVDMALAAAACVVAAALVGIAGALFPAIRASRSDPYDLIRGEG